MNIQQNISQQNYLSTTAATNNDLARNFAKRFVTVMATTKELVEKVQRLRYQVYCVENSYEDPACFPDGREHDEFDNNAIQGLLFDKTIQSIAGTVRLILPRPGKLGQRLPIQTLCQHHLLLDERLLAGNSAEISRFAISKEYRCRACSQLRCNGSDRSIRSAAADEQLLVNIALGLIKGIVQMSATHGITEIFAVMEPALLRLLGRFAIYFSTLGPLVKYHGMRQPCYLNRDAMLQRVRLERPAVWDVITDYGRWHGVA